MFGERQTRRNRCRGHFVVPRTMRRSVPRGPATRLRRPSTAESWLTGFRRHLARQFNNFLWGEWSPRASKRKSQRARVPNESRPFRIFAIMDATVVGASRSNSCNRSLVPVGATGGTLGIFQTRAIHGLNHHRYTRGQQSDRDEQLPWREQDRTWRAQSSGCPSRQGFDCASGDAVITAFFLQSAWSIIAGPYADRKQAKRAP